MESRVDCGREGKHRGEVRALALWVTTQRGQEGERGPSGHHAVSSPD